MHRSTFSAFHAAKIFAKVEKEADPSALVASWRRCINVHGLSPEGTPRPERRENGYLVEASQQSEAVIRAAAEPMDQLLSILEGSDHMIFLTDANGIVLETRSFRTSDFWERPRGDWAGTDFSETSHGTNGVGTVLRDKRPMTVCADEHFHVRNIAAVCSGAPIYGINGAIAGCIDVSSNAGRTDPLVNALMLQAAIETARRIELRMLAAAYSHSKLVFASQTGQHPGAVLAVDQTGGVVGATRSARLLLDLKPEQLKGTQSVEQLWTSGDGEDLSLAAAERRAIEIAMARYTGNASAAARALGVSRSTLLRKLSEFRRV